VVDLEYSRFIKRKKKHNFNKIFLQNTLSIDWAATGALEIESSICWSSNNFDSTFFVLFVVSVIFVVDASASEPSWDDALAAIKRRRFAVIVAGVV
jgi:hypothetical protein